MLIELANTTIYVLGDAVTTGFLDGLPNRLSQQHVLIRVRFKHPLQQQWPPRLLQLGPVLFTPFIKLVLVRTIPDWLDVEPLHLLSAASVNSTVVQE